MSEKPLKRRTLAKGLAWSVPVIAVAAAAPALAASPSPVLFPSGRGSWNSAWDSNGSDGLGNVKMFTVIPGTATPGSGFCIQNTTTGSRISNASVTYYITASERLTFTSGYSGGNGGWSNLTYDSTKSPRYYNGDAYLPYTTTYTGSITASNGNTCFPAYAFRSQNNVQTRSTFDVDHSVVVDGRTLTQNYTNVAMS